MPENEQTQTVDNGAEPAQSVSIDDLVGRLNELSAAEAEGQAAALPQDQEADPSPPEPDAGQESSGAEQDASEGPQKLTAKAAAEKLGIDVSDLYASLEIEIGKGNSLTLGEIKDRAKDLTQADALLADAQQQKLETQNELMQQRRMLERQMQRIGYRPSQHDLAEMQAEAEQYKSLQQRLAVEYMPEWKHEAARQADEKVIEAMQAEYHFSPAERALMIDARLLKMVRDYGNLRQQLRDAAKRYQRGKTPQAPKATTKTSNAVTDIASQVKSGKTSRGQAVDQLAKLLG